MSCVVFCQALVFLAFFGAMFFQLPIVVCSSAGQLLLEDCQLLSCGMLDDEQSTWKPVVSAQDTWKLNFSRDDTGPQGENGDCLSLVFDLHPIHPQLGHLGNGNIPPTLEKLGWLHFLLAEGSGESRFLGISFESGKLVQRIFGNHEPKQGDCSSLEFSV